MLPDRPLHRASFLHFSILRLAGMVLLTVIVLLTAACGGSGPGRLDKPATSSLWVDHRSAPLDADALGMLGGLGVGEFVVPVGRLDEDASDGLARLPLPTLPGSPAVTLAVLGDGPPRGDAKAVAGVLQQLRFEIENKGWVPRGVHLDLLGVSTFEGYAAFLKTLRTELGGDLFLSISLERSALEGGSERVAERLGAVLEQVDYVVAFLYGQRPIEAEELSAWDLNSVEERLKTLDTLQVPYQLGAVGIGTAFYESGETVLGQSSAFDLRSFLWNRNLKLRLGYSLEGGMRRLYLLDVEKPTQVGDWQLAAGDSVRIIRAGTTDLSNLVGMASSRLAERYLGVSIYRLPTVDERMSLTLENLRGALGPEPPTPDLEVRANVQRRKGSGRLFRFEIINRNGEITELSMVENNFLEIHATEGDVFGDVEVGDFYRYDLYRERQGKRRRMYRDANILRLHIPVLDGEARVSTGDVEIKMRNPQFEIYGQFLLPDGRTLKIGPYVWRNGSLSGPPDA